MVNPIPQKQNPMFEIVVEGQYKALGDYGGHSLKKYRAVFLLPSMEAALSQIVRHLLKPKLIELYPDYVRYRTHTITAMTAIGVKPNPEVVNMSIDEMTVDELFDFCLIKQIMIDPYKQKTVEAARELVAARWSEMRQGKKDDVEARNADDAKAAAQLLELNKLPQDKTEVEMTIRNNENKLNPPNQPTGRDRITPNTPNTSNPPPAQKSKNPLADHMNNPRRVTPPGELTPGELDNTPLPGFEPDAHTDGIS